MKLPAGGEMRVDWSRFLLDRNRANPERERDSGFRMRVPTGDSYQSVSGSLVPARAFFRRGGKGGNEPKFSSTYQNFSNPASNGEYTLTV